VQEPSVQHSEPPPIRRAVGRVKGGKKISPLKEPKWQRKGKKKKKKGGGGGGGGGWAHEQVDNTKPKKHSLRISQL